MGKLLVGTPAPPDCFRTGTARGVLTPLGGFVDRFNALEPRRARSRCSETCAVALVQ